MSSTNENSESAPPPYPPPTTAQTPVGAASATASPTSTNIGYCHECDRQIDIDIESFTCTVCNGGFIEMFEPDQHRQQQQQNANGADSGSNMRVFTFDANSANNMEVIY